jgi:hypothetical protein
MLRPFLFMTSMARDRLRMNSCSFGLGMGLDICDVIVATVTRVGAVNGPGKFPLADLRVTAQTVRIVDTLVAILPALHRKLLPLFRRFSGWGRLCRLDTLFFGHRCCRPHSPQAQKKERGRNDETEKDCFLKFGFHASPQNQEVD